jgi:hypothetical protein
MLSSAPVRSVLTMDRIRRYRAIVEEEDTLPDAPKRSGPELVRAGGALRNAVGQASAHVVNKEVGKKVRCLVRQGSAWDRRGAAGNHLTRGQRRRVAMGTTNFYEGRSSVGYGGRVGRRRGRSQHAHEAGKGFYVGDNRGIGSGGSHRRRKVECVVRRRRENAGRSLVALLRKHFVGNAHFHVIGLGRKQEQGFVLRFPPETSDGAIVCAAVHVAAQDRVWVTGNTQRGLQGRIGFLVGEDGGVWDRFDQAGSKNRRRYSEDNVGIPALAGERISRGQEDKLRDVATGGVFPAADNEQRVNIAVGDAVAFLEARFAHGAVRRDEPRHGVLCPIERRDSDQRVLRRA